MDPHARTAWFANPRADLLSGLVVALALIPEALSFSIIAGVDPKVGLYASFTIAIIRPRSDPSRTSVTGSSPPD